jgi:hypothetical protein
MSGTVPLEKIVRAFDCFEKPDHYINAQLYEPERDEYEQMLGGKAREVIEGIDFGSGSLNSLTHLTPQATAYLMPRLVELSELNTMDRHGEQFLMRFINYISLGPSCDLFSLFGTEQRAAVVAYLEFVADSRMEIVRQEFWDDVLGEAIQAWRAA